MRASKTGKAADLVEQAVHEILTCYGFPDIHWQKIRTTPERIMKEIWRRTRRRCFPRRSVLPQPGGRATTVYLKPKPLHDRMCERFWTPPGNRRHDKNSTSSG
jgi:hypothetical protein